jgi:AcrR family transcriptional regulator
MPEHYAVNRHAQTAPEGSSKTRILQKGEQLCARRGYNGVSMREIAEACRITKADIYYYFKDSNCSRLWRADVAAAEPQEPALIHAQGYPMDCYANIVHVGCAS